MQKCFGVMIPFHKIFIRVSAKLIHEIDQYFAQENKCVKKWNLLSSKGNGCVSHSGIRIYCSCG